MKTWTVVTGAALAAVLLAAAAPAPAAAQLGGLKRRLKDKLTEAAVEKAAGTSGARPDSGDAGAASASAGAPAAPARTGPTFGEHVLEITPGLLDRLEKGLAAERAVQQEIDRLVGRVLPREEYDRCRQAVIASPEGQRVYEQSADLLEGERTPEQLQRASEEFARRFERLTEPRCGLEPRKAEELRRQHADRLAAAAPQAAGLTLLQLSILKERILPACAAADALTTLPGEARIPTASAAVFWVYTEGEVAALQPRCTTLAGALRAGT